MVKVQVVQGAPDLLARIDVHLYQSKGSEGGKGWVMVICRPQALRARFAAVTAPLNPPSDKQTKFCDNGSSCLWCIYRIWCEVLLSYLLEPGKVVFVQVLQVALELFTRPHIEL